ncbi:MAG: hypothetical protein KDD06_14665 [Phaeodactylibacter sp.]|nr:hypothetical protein [Phaeodactylibacter sp.]MCB9267533.1 hypothetical protein [Lewinellaceae bacterium]MCB9288125.1 hypothetical protein [Lewinellaceae bacterium]
MLKRLILIIAILGTGFRFSSAQETAVQPSNAHPTAEKPVLEFYPSQSIEIRGLLGQGESFTSYLLISSARNMQLTAKAKPLRDADKGTFLRSDLLSLSPNSISIEAGRDAELTFTVKDGAEPGTYTGELELLDEKSKNSWAVPVEVSLRHDASAKIFPEDEAPQVNTVSRSFLNFLLPESIRQEGINIRIDNEGDEELAISNVSLALKGQGTNAAFTEAFLKLDTSRLNLEIGPKGLETLSLNFDKNALKTLPTDIYKGEFRVYFKDASEPLSTTVTVNKRMGAVGAILLLILGIVVGRWIKGLDKAKNQIELMDRFVPLRVKVDNLTDKLAQKQLWDELAQLEKEIDKVQSDESRAAVEEHFPPVEKKIARIQELEALFERLSEQFKEEKASSETKSQASQQLRVARDAILDGKEEEAQQALQKLDELMSAISKDKSKGILDEVILPAAYSVKRQMDKLFETMKDGEGEKEKAEQPGGWESFFFRAMQLISGVKMSARFRYGFVRPLVTLATFIVLLLLGFNEIYINGGETFGAAGIMDYLKLFLWGVVSDVFSRSLTSDDLVGGFIGK